MSAIKKSAKVKPVDVPPTKRDNFLEKSLAIVRQYRFVIYAEALMGINRVYLFQHNKIFLRMCYFHSFFLVLLTLYYVTAKDLYIYKITSCLEFSLLVFSSNFMQKRMLERFFQHLATVDEMLNITKDINISSPIRRSIFWTISSIVYGIFEYILLTIYVLGDFDYTTWIAYLAILVHDCEFVFFCALLRAVLRRVRIIKAHVAKSFLIAEKATSKIENFDEVEALSKNAYLDTTAMHRVYEKLHKCAETLNSAMSFPCIIMLLTSGLSTIILLKNIFKLADSNDDPAVVRAIIIYASVRCVKYTFLIVVPCLFSSSTTKQVSIIRTMLHDAISSIPFDKIERRKVKAFFQLAKDNEFAYALWGVVRLNMSLPLSYSSLCTTYLVIIIQFSKFID